MSTRHDDASSTLVVLGIKFARKHYRVGKVSATRFSSVPYWYCDPHGGIQIKSVPTPRAPYWSWVPEEGTNYKYPHLKSPGDRGCPLRSNVVSNFRFVHFG